MRKSSFPWTDLAMLGVVVIWGLNFTASKVVLNEVAPLAFVLGRYLVLSVISVIALFFFNQGLRERRHLWPQFLLLGVVGQALYQYFYSVGLDRTSTFHASVLLSSVPLFVALLSFFSRVERINRFQWVGVIISFVGLALFLAATQNDDNSASSTLLGNTLILGATVAWALYTILSKPILRESNPLELSSVTVLTGLPVMLAYGWKPTLEQNWQAVSFEAWISFAYSSIFPIYIAYLIWSWGITKIGTVRTSIYTYLVPIVTAFSSWIWIGEKVYLSHALLAGVVIFGMLLTRLPLRKWIRASDSDTKQPS